MAAKSSHRAASRKVDKPVRQTDRPRSRGAVQLARTALTAAEIATALGVSEVLVKYWRLGTRVPAIDKRKSLAREYAIPIEAWDEPATVAVVAPPKVEPVPETRFREMSSLLVAEGIALYQLLPTCESPMERAKLLKLINDCVDKAMRLGGIPIGVSEEGLMRLPAWQRALERTLAVVYAAIAPFPGAVKAAREAMQSRKEHGS